MINEKDLNTLLSNEKKSLLRIVEELNTPYEKVKFLNDFNKDVESLKENYDKLISFSKLLSSSIFEENPNLEKLIVFLEVVEDGLNIKWSKKDKKFFIEFDKSCERLITDEKTLKIVEEVLERISNKLGKYAQAYYLKLDQLKFLDWSEF